MAWPSTPITTYVANSTPTIKAADLNSIQSAINAIVNGTYNLQGVTLTTGTPGSIVAPVPGSLVAARSVFSTTIPTPSTLSAGEHFRESAPASCGSFAGTGMGLILKSGFGIAARSRVTTGDYTVTLQRVPTGPTADNVVAVVSGLADVIATCSISLDGMNRPVLSVRIYAITPGSPANLTAVDSNFFFAAWVF